MYIGLQGLTAKGSEVVGNWCLVTRWMSIGPQGLQVIILILLLMALMRIRRGDKA